MSGYALFLDDERFPPGSKRKRPDGLWWVIARSSTEALSIIDRLGWPEFISFDHDLGGDDTAMVFLRQVIDRLLATEEGRGQPLTAPQSSSGLPFKWTVHSMNPIGRRNIEGLLNGYARQFPGAQP